MTTTRRHGIFQPHTLALAVALGISAPAYAVNFNIGAIEGQFDSSMSVGASWAMENADPELVGVSNFVNSSGKRGTGATQTGDDGRLNFKKGETFSKIFKASHDLELKYGDTGVFIRGKYWYDFELKDEDREFKNISDSNRKEAAQSAGAQILDAFIYHNYSLGDLPGSVRAGRQVVSWGESTFIGNSINSINPIDAAAFRRPGAEVKEGLIPVNMLYVSQSLTDQLAMEAFYQLEWDQTIADNCGTFFGGDVVADGCNNNYHVQGPLSAAQIAGLAGFGVRADGEGIIVPRGEDRDARDSGQWGLALRWLGEETEYGFYAMNYHSRTPNVGVQNTLNPTIAGLGAAAAGAKLGTGTYYLEYPEDIRLYGASFATTLPTGTSWAGEVSYRPNMPLQYNTTELTGRLAAVTPATVGFDNKGYERKEVSQFQTTFTHFFDQVMGAGRVTVVGEIGATHIGGHHDGDFGEAGLRFGRDSIYGAFNANDKRHGYMTGTSWGYRARAIWDYSDVFAGVNLSPSISWSHDVDGYGPVFNEGSKAISLGVDANYRNTYTASLSYTDFFGGDYNTQIDRDFLAFSVGMNF